MRRLALLASLLFPALLMAQQPERRVVVTPQGDTITTTVFYTDPPARIDSIVTLAKRAPTKPDTVKLPPDTVRLPAEPTPTPVPIPTPVPTAGYQVTASGTSTGDGSTAKPWSLAYAAAGAGGKLKFGDTVWVRAGTHKGRIRATAAGVTYRSYPGERAIQDGGIEIGAPDVTIRALEILESSPVGKDQVLVDVRGARAKVINNVIHDASASCLGAWAEAPDAEITGNILYNCGTHTNLDHGLYIQNSTGRKLLRDNIVFHNFAYGLHAYASTTGKLANIQVEGLVSFNNGAIGSSGPDIFIGGGTAFTGFSLRDSYTYRTDQNATARIGYVWWSGWNETATLRNLTLVGTPPVAYFQIRSLDTAGIVGYTPDKLPTSGTKVIVRPNPYEAGRGHVVAYNWAKQASVAVDLSSVLKPGDRYEVRHVFKPFDAPLLSGTYQGGTVAFPMTAVAPPAPIGRGKTPPAVGPTFGAFLITRN